MTIMIIFDVQVLILPFFLLTKRYTYIVWTWRGACHCRTDASSLLNKPLFLDFSLIYYPLAISANQLL